MSKRNSKQRSAGQKLGEISPDLRRQLRIKEDMERLWQKNDGFTRYIGTSHVRK